MNIRDNSNLSQTAYGDAFIAKTTTPKPMLREEYKPENQEATGSRGISEQLAQNLTNPLSMRKATEIINNNHVYPRPSSGVEMNFHVLDPKAQDASQPLLLIKLTPEQVVITSAGQTKDLDSIGVRLTFSSTVFKKDYPELNQKITGAMLDRHIIREEQRPTYDAYTLPSEANVIRPDQPKQ